MMNRRQAAREKMELRHRVGTYFGYFGLFMGLMSIVSTQSEGTPLAPGISMWVVFAWMLGTYVVGWALGPLIARLAGANQ